MKSKILAVIERVRAAREACRAFDKQQADDVNPCQRGKATLEFTNAVDALLAETDVSGEDGE